MVSADSPTPSLKHSRCRPWNSCQPPGVGPLSSSMPMALVHQLPGSQLPHGLENWKYYTFSPTCLCISHKPEQHPNLCPTPQGRMGSGQGSRENGSSVRLHTESPALAADHSGCLHRAPSWSSFSLKVAEKIPGGKCKNRMWEQQNITT